MSPRITGRFAFRFLVRWVERACQCARFETPVFGYEDVEPVQLSQKYLGGCGDDAGPQPVDSSPARQPALFA